VSVVAPVVLAEVTLGGETQIGILFVLSSKIAKQVHSLTLLRVF
jgi:hypothetical protein